MQSEGTLRSRFGLVNIQQSHVTTIEFDGVVTTKLPYNFNTVMSVLDKEKHQPLIDDFFFKAKLKCIGRIDYDEEVDIGWFRSTDLVRVFFCFENLEDRNRLCQEWINL